MSLSIKKPLSANKTRATLQRSAYRSYPHAFWTTESRNQSRL